MPAPVQNAPSWLNYLHDAMSENVKTYGGAAMDLANIPADLTNAASRAITGKDVLHPLQVPQPTAKGNRLLRAALPYGTGMGDAPALAEGATNLLLRKAAASAGKVKASNILPYVDDALAPLVPTPDQTEPPAGLSPQK